MARGRRVSKNKRKRHSPRNLNHYLLSEEYGGLSTCKLILVGVISAVSSQLGLPKKLHMLPDGPLVTKLSESEYLQR
jgi:hypothetical protein